VVSSRAILVATKHQEKSVPSVSSVVAMTDFSAKAIFVVGREAQRFFQVSNAQLFKWLML
jgi:actin-like ATPase involved in cell morphogenesis